MRGFTAYPPAKKMRGRNDIRMVSNVGARRKWLEKYVPEWRGPEVWSEKRVKMYIDDIKSGKGYTPVAKKAKIPWAWGCRPIPQMATVEQFLPIVIQPERTILLSLGTYVEDGFYNDFI